MDVTFYSKLNIFSVYDFDFNKIFPGKHESGMFELVDTGNQQSNKEVDWQKSILCTK